MITRRILQYAVLLAGLAFIFQSPVSASAQNYDGQNNYDYDDPPDQVARMNYSAGSVSFQPGNEGEWIAASTNRPLTVGDNLWADAGSRAEMHIGSTALRLSSDSSLSFLDLRNGAVQLRLSQGKLFLHVPRMNRGAILEVDTPNTAFTVLEPGDYRVDVNNQGNETLATVWHGQAEAVGGGYSYTVAAGQQARFYGTDQLNYQIARVPDSDDFDNWAFDRDRSRQNLEAVRYVSPDMTGYEDLDQYGRWDNVAEYGPVWRPSLVPSNWAPYSSGHWVSIQPWGWTWVDDEPWGFAPFHYGRWAQIQNRWSWIPGPIRERPVYAPALVAFIGGPQGFQVGGGPGIGWFPLGPGEVFVPSYRVTPRYVTRVNVSNTVVQTTRVTTVYNYYTTNNRREIETVKYINRQVPDSVTVVSRDTFVNARPVSGNVVRVSADQIAKAPVEREVGVQPVKASVLGPNAVAKARPPAAIAERPVVAKRMPPVVRPVNQTADAAQGQPRNSPAVAQKPLVKAAPAVKQKNPPQQQAQNAPNNNPANERVQPSNKANEGRSPAAVPQPDQPNKRQTPETERRKDMTQPAPKPAPQPQPDRRNEPAQPRPDNPQVDRRQAEPRQEVPRPEPKAVPQPEKPDRTPQPHPETPEVDRRQAEPKRQVPPSPPEPRKEVTPPQPNREVTRPEPGKEAPVPEPRRESPDTLRPAPRPEPNQVPKAEPQREVPRPPATEEQKKEELKKQLPQDERPQPPNQN